MLDSNLEAAVNQILTQRRVSELRELLHGYRISSLSEGKSHNTIAIVEASVRYLEQFLIAHGLSTDISDITAEQLRRFAVYLRERPRFARHRFTPPQPGHLSGHTVSAYMRALQSFWSWLEREGLVQENPFRKLKPPKAPQKIIPVFTEDQLRRLFASVDLTSPNGYRDYAIMLLLLDTGIRCSELAGLKVEDVDLDSRLIKVWGKGNKQRLVPIGAKVQKALWKYIHRHRPDPALPRYHHLFLTRDGRPLTKDRVEAIVECYGKRAGITGVRVSPHTFRHTMAVTYLRNGGDIFSLQQILGHSSLEVLRNYVNLALSDIQGVHRRSSPADNIQLKPLRDSR